VIRAHVPAKDRMMPLHLTPDGLLSTTRAVRKRLDLTRPVPRELIEECVDLATQAPTGRNRQRRHFLVVTGQPQRTVDVQARPAHLGLRTPPSAF
jgi:hypothetical protein